MKQVILLLPFVALIVSGCATRPTTMVQQHYLSPATTGNGNTRSDGVSIRVNDFESTAVDRKMGPLLIPKAILPLIGFLPTTDGKLINSVAGPPKISPTLAEDEVEKIMVEEIAKSGLAKEVTFGDEPKEYEINGTVNFITKVNLHMSGLGMIYQGLLPMFIFPNASYNAICNAHLEVVSTRDSSVLLSKDYVAESGWWKQWPLYNSQRTQNAYGKEVFPQIVKQFLQDLEVAIGSRNSSISSL